MAHFQIQDGRSKFTNIWNSIQFHFFCNNSHFISTFGIKGRGNFSFRFSPLPVLLTLAWKQIIFWDCKEITIVLIKHFRFIAVFIERGCDQLSTEREPCSPDLKAPFVKPEDCIKKGCCYDDMFMGERELWYYNPTGRVWCFTKEGGRKYACMIPFERLICIWTVFYVIQLLLIRNAHIAQRRNVQKIWFEQR